MKVIRDNDGGGLYGLALCIEWGVQRCNNWGCSRVPTVTVTGLSHPEEGDLSPIGLCEECFQLGNKPGGHKYVFGFGDPAEEATREPDPPANAAEGKVRDDG